jgi:hypothetical protein
MQGLGSLVHVLAVSIYCSCKWMWDTHVELTLLRALTGGQGIGSESLTNNTVLDILMHLCSLCGDMIAQSIKWLCYGLDNRQTLVQFPALARYFSLHQSVQTGSGAHPTSCPVGTGGSITGDKAAGTWSWQLTSIYCRCQGRMELHVHSL